MINHPDNMAGFYKEDKEIYEFFKLNKGNEEKILKRELNFVAGQGYTNAIQLSIISVVFCHREPLFFMPKNFKNITKNS